MPSVHARVTCDTCNKEMRADKLKAHLRTHEVNNIRVELRKEKELKVKGLRQQLKHIIGKGNLEQMYHMYYRVDAIKPEASANNIESHFNIAANLACSCGATRDCTHPHTHLLGTWNGIHEGNKHRSLHKYFTEERAYSCKSIGPYKTLEDKISSIKHFIHTACYIQTKRGWHKKTAQRNPYTFPGIEEKNLFLSEMYREWMWAQVSYMRYTMKKIDQLSRALDFCEDIEKCERMRDQIARLDAQMVELEEVWGEEHHYTDEEMEKDLEMFLDHCKEIGNS